MMQDEAAEQRAQNEAFEAYKAAKARVDETLTFSDAMAAKRAWWNFLNTFEARTAVPLRLAK